MSRALTRRTLLGAVAAGAAACLEAMPGDAADLGAMLVPTISAAMRFWALKPQCSDAIIPDG